MPSEAVCVIPARGGSKRILRKNLVPLDGKPLIVHTIEHALQASEIEGVYVSTDDPEIAAVSRSAGACVIQRPPKLAGDAATSESVLANALDAICASRGKEPDLVVFLQCTSPIRKLGDIDRAVQTLRDAQADSLFSACRSHALLWAKRRGELCSLSYDHRNRLRDQEAAQQYRENGSIYVFKPWVLRRFGNRLGGRIAIYPMDFWSSFQVDCPEDLLLCEWILKRQRIVGSREREMAG